MRFKWIGAVLLLSGAAFAARADLPTAPAASSLSLKSFPVPGLSASALQFALQAYHRLQSKEPLQRQRLTVIDYSLPSTQKRLWVLDPESGEVLFAERVAHGRGSGDLVASRFGNVPESHRTSLGVFRTAETYQGAHGYSLRLDGLEKGVNDRMREREIVFHAASYATESFAQKNGRLGRSFGCPALDPARARAIIDAIRGGSIVVALQSQPG
jgi:hypothetical protein